MKTTSLFIIGLLCSPALWANGNTSANQKAQQADWQILFDGTDTSQWRNFKQKTLNSKWKVIDGALTLTEKGGGDILTQEQYENFELELEWKVSLAGNSGIFILADETGQHIYSHAPEIQILDNERHSDNKLPTHLSGSLYDLIEAPAKSQKPAGEWNQVKISLLRGHLQVWQNGVQTVDIQIGSERWDQLVKGSKFAKWQGFGKNPKGHIGLQDHGDNVAFRNIKIRELQQ